MSIAKIKYAVTLFIYTTIGTIKYLGEIYPLNHPPFSYAHGDLERVYRFLLPTKNGSHTSRPFIENKQGMQ